MTKQHTRTQQAESLSVPAAWLPAPGETFARHLAQAGRRSACPGSGTGWLESPLWAAVEQGASISWAQPPRLICWSRLGRQSCMSDCPKVPLQAEEGPSSPLASLLFRAFQDIVLQVAHSVHLVAWGHPPAEGSPAEVVFSWKQEGNWGDSYRRGPNVTTGKGGNMPKATQGGVAGKGLWRGGSQGRDRRSSLTSAALIKPHVAVSLAH